MGLRRLLKSIAWKLIPYAEINFKLESGLELEITDKGEWACLEESFVNRVYEPFFRDIHGVNGWVDLGCNVGYFSLALENHLRSNGGGTPTRALLIDANELCVKTARKNIGLNSLSGWTAKQAVLGPEGESVQFHQFKYSIHSGIFSNQKGEKVITYPTVPLKTLLSDREIPRDLIKIDIEGAERNLLKQERELVTSFRYGICEWHAPEMTGSDLQQFCKDAGLEILHYKSQPLGWDLSRGDSFESPIGMVSWRNPQHES